MKLIYPFLFSILALNSGYAQSSKFSKFNDKVMRIVTPEIHLGVTHTKLNVYEENSSGIPYRDIESCGKFGYLVGLGYKAKINNRWDIISSAEAYQRRYKNNFYLAEDIVFKQWMMMVHFGAQYHVYNHWSILAKPYGQLAIKNSKWKLPDSHDWAVAIQKNNITTWGITSGIAYDLKNWQLSALLSNAIGKESEVFYTDDLGQKVGSAWFKNQIYSIQLARYIPYSSISGKK